ncbi:hypothetical protein [Flavobacteriaceae bacterium 14752]|uniref:hypothetical protein n=1 Tax=Mesohalobacter salilacus TaxID=2491711 RepID=UPI000F6424BF|nr:hypothetical protein EIG84_11460 [Flavobacteriaceae bacterium 14752]
MKKLLCFLAFASSFSYAQDKPIVDLGGALRYNYNLSSWKGDQKDRGGDFGYDVFRINTDVEYKGIRLQAEYRFYSEGFGGDFMKSGWLGYDFNEKENLQLGLTQVPFGITQYNSHNWFFNITYYTGLEDDHDMGVKYSNVQDKFEYYLAFFKGAEETLFGGSTESVPNRYSYDVIGRNKEVNQFNGKFIYKLGDSFKHRFGISGQYGGLYNLDTEETGDHYGLALHYELDFKTWNIKSEFAYIDNNPINAPGESRDVIQMGAYGFPYEVAADYEMYTLAVSKSVKVDWGPVSNLQFYNDFGYMHKRVNDFNDSFMNVTGVLVTAGNLYTYIDYAAGYNHSWLGGNFIDDFSIGNPNAKWEARFNINFGYYFLTDNKSR